MKRVFISLIWYTYMYLFLGTNLNHLNTMQWDVFKWSVSACPLAIPNVIVCGVGIWRRRGVLKGDLEWLNFGMLVDGETWWKIFLFWLIDYTIIFDRNFLDFIFFIFSEVFFVVVHVCDCLNFSAIFLPSTFLANHSGKEKSTFCGALRIVAIKLLH